jgi:glycosyltransferase involved in cell wall biosynthesis
VYGIFIKRQVDSVRAAGIRCDVLYQRGYASRLAYPSAALRLLVSTIRWRNRYRLIHVHAGETALAARCHLGTPMLVSYCGDDVLGDPDESGRVPPRKRLRAAAGRTHSRLFPAVITKSNEMADRLPKRTRRRTTVLPNGVNTNVFRPLDRAEARERVGWSDDERVALFAATRPESPRKRRGLAEAACREAADKIGPVHLHVTGDCSPDDMPVLLNAADCLLLTSSIEGSPNVVKEAVMCNLPVVTTPTGDVEEILAAVEPSWICEPTPAALGDALTVCLRSRTRSNGRAVAGWLDERRIAERLIALYRQLAPEVGRRGVRLAPEATS